MENFTNHNNIRIDSYNGSHSRTGQVSMSFSDLFLILPAAGIIFEWDRSQRGH